MPRTTTWATHAVEAANVKHPAGVRRRVAQVRDALGDAHLYGRRAGIARVHGGPGDGHAGGYPRRAGGGRATGASPSASNNVAANAAITATRTGVSIPPFSSPGLVERHQGDLVVRLGGAVVRCARFIAAAHNRKHVLPGMVVQRHFGPDAEGMPHFMGDRMLYERAGPVMRPLIQSLGLQSGVAGGGVVAAVIRLFKFARVWVDSGSDAGTP